MTLLSDHSSRLSSVRNGLHEPAERSAALSVAALLPTREKQQLLPDLLELAAFTHGLTRQARNIILSMGRDWLEKNIESHAEPILMRNDDEEYAGLLELYKLPMARTGPPPPMKVGRVTQIGSTFTPAHTS